MDNIIYLVFESGSGYGESLNAFYKKEAAQAHFKEVCEGMSEFTDKTPEEQKEVLDNQELQCDDGGVIKIVPLAVE